MTTLHPQIVGDKALLPREEFEHVVKLARQTESIEVDVSEDEIPAIGIARLAENGGALDWLANEPDLYTVSDLKVRYR